MRPLADFIVNSQRRVKYFYGNLIANLLVNRLGNQTLISPSVEYYEPSKIEIGDFVEIRDHTILDARTTEQKGILIGSKCRIKEGVSLVCYSGQIVLSENVLLGKNDILLGHGGISIGEKTMISPNCLLVASNHVYSLNGIDFQDQGFTKEPILIGRNVWIGGSSTILGGSIIEDNVVVAAGSVVNSTRLENGYLYGGIPAKKIRKIKSIELVDKERYFKTWNSFSISK